MSPKFTLGAISGMSALALAVPLLAQMAGAQTSGAITDEATDVVYSREAKPFMEKHAMTQEDVQEMVERTDAFLEHADELFAIHTQAMQAHRDALAAAANIADDDVRRDAVHAAHEAMRTMIDDAMEANPELKDAMPFGMGMMHKGIIKMRGHGPMGGDIAEKFGMTADELKAAIESGKTIEEIAEENGVELPAHPMKFKRMKVETSEQ